MTTRRPLFLSPTCFWASQTVKWSKWRPKGWFGVGRAVRAPNFNHHHADHHAVLHATIHLWFERGNKRTKAPPGSATQKHPILPFKTPRQEPNRAESKGKNKCKNKVKTQGEARTPARKGENPSLEAAPLRGAAGERLPLLTHQPGDPCDARPRAEGVGWFLMLGALLLGWAKKGNPTKTTRFLWALMGPPILTEP